MEQCRKVLNLQKCACVLTFRKLACVYREAKWGKFSSSLKNLSLSLKMQVSQMGINLLQQSFLPRVFLPSFWHTPWEVIQTSQGCLLLLSASLLSGFGLHLCSSFQRISLLFNITLTDGDCCDAFSEVVPTQKSWKDGMIFCMLLKTQTKPSSLFFPSVGKCIMKMFMDQRCNREPNRCL